MPRIFVAFTIGDAARAEIARVSAVADLRGVSWVVPENLHATVAFIGDHPQDGLDAIEDGLRAGAAECAPVEVRLGSLDGFPRAERARVVWVGLSDPGRTLHACADVLRRALMQRVGSMSFGEGSYVPHVTVARAHRKVREVAVPHVPVAPVGFTISSVELFESILRGGKPPRYEVLASFPFARSAASS